MGGDSPISVSHEVSGVDLLQQLQNELLLAKVREYCLDVELSDFAREFPDTNFDEHLEVGESIDDPECDKIEVEAIRAVGRLEVSNERLLSKERELQKFGTETRDIKERTNDIAQWAKDFLHRDVIHWTQSMYDKCRDSSSLRLPQLLVSELEQAGVNRENYSAQVQQRVSKAEKTSLGLLGARMQKKLLAAQEDIKKIERDSSNKEQKIINEFSAEQDEVLDELEELQVISREHRFHLRRGSHFKKVDHTDLLTDVNGQSSPQRSRETQDVYDSIASLQPRLAKQKSLEIRVAEESLWEVKGTLKSIEQLVQRRRLENQELSRLRDGLFKEVDATKASLLENSPRVPSSEVPALYAMLSDRRLYNRSDSPATTPRRVRNASLSATTPSRDYIPRSFSPRSTTRGTVVTRTPENLRKSAARGGKIRRVLTTTPSPSPARGGAKRGVSPSPSPVAPRKTILKQSPVSRDISPE